MMKQVTALALAVLLACAVMVPGIAAGGNGGGPELPG